MIKINMVFIMLTVLVVIVVASLKFVLFLNIHYWILI